MENINFNIFGRRLLQQGSVMIIFWKFSGKVDSNIPSNAILTGGLLIKNQLPVPSESLFYFLVEK